MSYQQPQPVYLPPPYRCSTAHVVIAWVLAVLTGFYLLPWAIAATRNRTNVGAIAAVNTLLGWTVIGWIVALVMACGSNPLPTQIVVTHNNLYASLPPSPYGPAPYLPPPLPPVYGTAPSYGPHDTRPIELDAYPPYTVGSGYEITQPLPPLPPRPDGYRRSDPSD